MFFVCNGVAFLETRSAASHTMLISAPEKERILFIAHQVNCDIARIIIYSATAKKSIDNRDGFFNVMNDQRIKSYSNDSIAIHQNRTNAARIISCGKRRELLQRKASLTLEEVSLISFEVGSQHCALNCSAQALMASYLLKKANITAILLAVVGVDHAYLGLKNDKGELFAITDPWSGRVIVLNTPEAKTLSQKVYGFFSGRLEELISFDVTSCESRSIRLD